MVWLAVFAALTGASALLARDAVVRLMAGEARTSLQETMRVRYLALAAIESLRQDIDPQEICEPAMRTALRRVALLPDGLSEFVRVVGNRIDCAVSADLSASPLELGPPDVTLPRPDNPIRLWLDRRLELGNILISDGLLFVAGNYGVIVPTTPEHRPVAEWLSLERVIRSPEGSWQHRGGDTGLYHAEDAPDGTVAPSPLELRSLYCEPATASCVTVRADLIGAAADWSALLSAMLVVLALGAAWITDRAIRALRHRWEFKARLRRGLNSERVTCHYQPLLNLRNGQVAGCEVLARWRDTDGSIVYPDSFIPIIEADGATRTFTALVIRRAHEDLARIVPRDMPFQVNINIFPRDFLAPVLIELLEPFLNDDRHFHVVVELVESAAITVDTLSGEIEALKQAGISTYIDDFGTGYANLQALAGVPIDGVKLDKSFAMAPTDSMMGRMLPHALEMISVLGRQTVVEGIETEERLALLRASGQADLGQGYAIARPLDAEGLASYLRRPRVVRAA